MYGFADGDPVTYSDPYGLCATSTSDTIPEIGYCRQPIPQGGVDDVSLDIALNFVPWSKVIGPVRPLLGRLGGGLASLLGRRVAGRLAAQSMDDVLRNPQILRAGNGVVHPDDVAKIAGGNWVETAGTKGAHATQVRAFRELLPNGRLSGRVARWHPGGGHHGPEPYWAVSDGQTLTRVGPQF